MLRASYASGFFPRDGKPAFPSLWRDCVSALHPGLGPTGGRLLDWSGYKRHGTLTNMDPATDWVIDQSGNVIDFDGTDDFIDMSLGGLLTNTTEFSVSFWLKSSLVNFAHVWSHGSTQRTTVAWKNAANTMEFIVFGGTAMSFTVTENKWNHVACTFRSSGYQRAYVNGVLAASQTPGSEAPSTFQTPFNIGRRSSGSLHLTGRLTDFLVHHRTLVDHEIQLLASRPGIAYERRPSIFRGATPVVEEETTTTTITVKRDHGRPTYQNGFARSAAESRWPSLWRGLVGAWNPGLGPTGSTLYDWSGYSRHGTLTNMDPASDWAIGERGYALDFDGSNDCVLIDSGSDIADKRLTAHAWIKTGGTQPATIGTIIAKQRTGTYTYNLNVRNSGKASFSIYNGTLNPEVEGTTVLSGWVHVCGTYDGSTVAIYVNGKQENTLSSSINLTTGGQLRIGANAGTTANLFFLGQILDVGIYNRVLAGREIQQLSLRPGIAYERREQIIAAAAPAAAAPPAITYRPQFMLPF